MPPSNNRPRHNNNSNSRPLACPGTEQKARATPEDASHPLLHFGKLLISFVGVAGFLPPLHPPSPSAIVVLVVYLGLWLSESVATFWGEGAGSLSLLRRWRWLGVPSDSLPPPPPPKPSLLHSLGSPDARSPASMGRERVLGAVVSEGRIKSGILVPFQGFFRDLLPPALAVPR